ncbi:MAG: hypothetical protein AB7G93_11425 [Bdellovibrionales bacterium]
MDKLEKISFASPPQKVFRNIEHYKKVRAAILSALSNSRSGGGGKRNGETASYLINRLVVKFTDSVDAEEIFIDYENGRVVLEAPILKGESDQNETDRRMYYYNNLIRSVEAIATIGITHIYLVLDDEGRKELEAQKTKGRKKTR